MQPCSLSSTWPARHKIAAKATLGHFLSAHVAIRLRSRKAVATFALPVRSLFEFSAARVAELCFGHVDVVLGTVGADFHGLRLFHRALAALAATL